MCSLLKELSSQNEDELQLCIGSKHNAKKLNKNNKKNKVIYSLPLQNQVVSMQACY